MKNQEIEEWQKDIKQAEGIHPNSFANGPIVRSLFRVNVLLESITEEIKNFNETTSGLTKKANKLIWWYVILTGVIAIVTIVNIFL